MIGYFAGWGVYERAFFVKDLETSGSAAKLTHINYAFANVLNGEVTIGDPYADYDMAYTSDKSVDGTSDPFDPGILRGSFRQLQELKTLHPNLKVMISVGGASWSNGFPAATATAAARKTLIDSAISRFIRGNFAAGVVGPGVFDGIDLDWEFPTKAEAPQFSALLSEMRAALDVAGQEDGKTYLLSIAAPAGPQTLANLQLPAIAASVDWVNVMTYDYHGAWENRTNFHAPLGQAAADPDAALGFSIENTMKLYKDGGIPPQKLVLGVPFYGRGWSGVMPGPNGDGLYQDALGPAPAKFEVGIEDWKILKGLEATYQTYTHPETKAFWIYSPQKQLWWSYDNATSMNTKMQFVKTNGFGGAMVWELSGDDAAGTLLSTIAAGLN